MSEIGNTNRDLDKRVSLIEQGQQNAEQAQRTINEGMIESQKENTKAVQELTEKIVILIERTSKQDDRMDKQDTKIETVQRLCQKNKERLDINQSTMAILKAIGLAAVTVLVGYAVNVFLGKG